MSLRLGIDTGGTFTDFVRLGPSGLVVFKLRSTPDDPSRAILDGVAQLAEREPDYDVVHGSTVATNAVLERKGARVALVATAGFEDVLRIGRQTRPELYNIFVPLPRPLVEPGSHVRRRRAARRRRARRSSPLDDAAVDRLSAATARARRRRRRGLPAALLRQSRRTSSAVAERLRARRAGSCRRRHEVLPEYREFERWSTTVVNAYVTPLIDRYLGALEATARRRRGCAIMQSNGGSISARGRARAGRAHGAVGAGGRRRRRAGRRARPPAFRA